VKQIIWSKSARHDIERIQDFVTPSSFPDIAEAIVMAARFIAAAPKVGPMVGNSFYRKWPVKRFPYLLLYRPEENAIHIARVHLAAQNWMSGLL
jgi:toxin ParE1/3/4